jgi:D-alanine-D-alanine ligase
LIDGESKEVFVNEVNTLPGSLYQHNWKKAGVSNVDLVTKLINYAEECLVDKSKNDYLFSSEILSQYRGPKIS